jgi:F0F1-type ATP synthase membrane subunit c/vacuolar-type H+-ATPase subunit K
MGGVAERGPNEKTLLSLWIIWAAMMGSLLLYVVICHQFGEEIRRNVGYHFPVPLLRNIFYVIAVITLFLTHFLKKRILSGASRDSSSTATPPGPHSNQPPVLAKYATALILSLALSESIGIYGVVLFLLGDGFKTLYIFTGISALAIYFHRPKREELEALAPAVQTEETATTLP